MPASAGNIGQAIGLQAKVDYSGEVNKLLDIQQKAIATRAKQYEDLKAKKQAQDEEYADLYNKIDLKGVDEHWTPELKRRAADVITTISEQKSKDPYGYWINHPELKKKVKDLIFDIEDKQNKSKELWDIRKKGAAGVINGSLEETPMLKLFRENPDEYRKQMYALTGDSEAIIPDAFYKARIKPINIDLRESQALKDVPTSEPIGGARKVGEGKQAFQKYKVRDEKALRAAAEDLYQSEPYIQQIHPNKEAYISAFVNSNKKVKSHEVIESIPQSSSVWEYGKGSASNPEYEVSTQKRDNFDIVTVKPKKKDTFLPDGAWVDEAGVEHVGKFDRFIKDKRTGKNYIQVIAKKETVDENGKNKVTQETIRLPFERNEGELRGQIGDLDFKKLVEGDKKVKEEEVKTITTQQEYDALPKGTKYKDSKGNIGTKR